MSFNESLADPKTLDDIGRDLSTMYVVCYMSRSEESSISSKLTRLRLSSHSTIVSFLPFNASTHTAVPKLTPRPCTVPPQLVGFAGFTVLIYDHLITFADEVRPFTISAMSID